MEYAVELMAGLLFLAMGISFLVNPDLWTAWVQHIQSLGTRAAIPLGASNLLFGGLILGFHWDWEGLPIVLTLIGVAITIKGATYLIFPATLPHRLAFIEPRLPKALRVSGVVMTILGLFCFYLWWNYY